VGHHYSGLSRQVYWFNVNTILISVCDSSRCKFDWPCWRVKSKCNQDLKINRAYLIFVASRELGDIMKLAEGAKKRHPHESWGFSHQGGIPSRTHPSEGRIGLSSTERVYPLKGGQKFEYFNFFLVYINLLMRWFHPTLLIHWKVKNPLTM